MDKKPNEVPKSKTQRTIKDLVDECIERLGICGSYRVEFPKERVFDYPGEEIDVLITFDSRDDPFMAEVSQLYDLKRRLEDIFSSEGYTLDHLLVSGVPQGLLSMDLQLV
ncbi:MAG: hypothetical protein HXX80_00370 [Nitrososphaerales archaeon]|nr:hypothetical protein [Nitrososphaerales archaeon]